MNALSDVLDTLRKNLRTVLAVMVIALLFVAYFVFLVNTIIPQWQLRQSLLSRIETAESTLSARPQPQQGAPDELQAQIDAANLQLAEAGVTFLTEPQAAELLDSLYQYAAESSVEVIDLQAQSAVDGGAKSVFDVRKFGLQAAGSFPQLLDFVARIRETAVSSIIITNLNSYGDQSTGQLSLDLHLYTSPYAVGSALANLPEPIVPTPQPPSQATVQPTESLNADNLFAQIDDPWTLEDWPTVISILEQLLILDPTFPEVNEKLYAAYVNYGHQLSGNGNKSGAQSAFENALAIQPDGGEAQLGLNALLEVTSTPTVTTYIVVGGDTLFSISQRFGTTVDALRAANGLVGNAISPGQTLIIPHS